jgi:hypothetical protein
MLEELRRQKAESTKWKAESRKRKLLVEFGLPGWLGPFPARPASTPTDWKCLHRLLITVHRPSPAPTSPDPECAP